MKCLSDIGASRQTHVWQKTCLAKPIRKLRRLRDFHGPSFLVQDFTSLSDEYIFLLSFFAGIPLVYELDENLKPLKHYYLGNEEEVAKAMAKVAAQGKKK